MKIIAASFLAIFMIPPLINVAAEPVNQNANIYPQIQTYLKARVAEFDQIPEARKTELEKISQYVKSHIAEKKPVRLTFICTHNSRRSHLSQIWSATAASFYGVGGIETYSGGTEATAFNPRAVAAIKRAGLKVEVIEDGKNPRYGVRFQEIEKPLVCFSKTFAEAPNPSADFCAVMTCSQADQNCPVIEGSSCRIGVPFEDPKVADGKPEEEATYDERCQQICREMLFVFSRVPLK